MNDTATHTNLAATDSLAPDARLDPIHRTGSSSLSRAASSRSGSSTKKAPSEDLTVTKTASSAFEHLHGLQAVRSAAHAARQKLHLDSIHASGPSKLFNPTNVRVHVKWKGVDEKSTDGSASDHALLWRSRDNRKGRNSIAVPNSAVKPDPISSRFTSSAKDICKNTWLMLTGFPYWDMAFWSGWSYTWGSVLFVIDGAWSFTEVAFPGVEKASLTKYGGPLCFFFGALLYQIGATVAYLEAVNDGSFRGSAMRRFLEGHESDAKQLVDEKIHSFFSHLVPHHHHHKEEDEEAFPAPKAPGPRRGAIDLGAAEEGTSTLYMTWRWWPDWKTLKEHHVYEIGYLACVIQLFGATLYAICGVVVLPGILSSLEDWQKEGAFWVPQIVASVCFLTAALLFTLETQDKFYRPEPTVIGWWIGVWAVVGSMGFLLCAIFGSASFDVEWGEYQSDLSSTWGSAAYLMSGLLQWYEATNKRPIQELLYEPGEMKSYQVHPI